ncbi:MAG TPA: hypothetical protein VGJ60_07785 [Chloroflexota bacterium]
MSWSALARDEIFRMANEAEPTPPGMPPRCPRCRSACDVRRFPSMSPPIVWIDCWRCKVSWSVESEGE